MSKRGLPIGVQMRHDAHYVEELSGHYNAPIGRLLLIDLIDPNPEQPRVEIGDLTELVSSIREKGVLEPLLVKPSTTRGRWMIIAGERRWRASKVAGLRELPCIEMNVDEGAVAEIALIENLQRKDLTPWEEADGLAALCEKYGYTHEDIAQKVGKSRTSITESIAIASLPEAVREKCRRADISAKSTLLELARQPDEDSLQGLLEKITRQGLNREGIRNMRRSNRVPSEGKTASPTYTYDSPGNAFKVQIFFKNHNFVKEEIELALREALGALEGSPIKVD